MRRAAWYGRWWVAFVPALCGLLPATFGLLRGEAPLVQPQRFPPIDVTKLVFDQPEVQRQFERYDAAARRFAAGFQHQPYRWIGDMAYADWWKGSAKPGDERFPRGGDPSEDIHSIYIQMTLDRHSASRGAAEPQVKPTRAVSTAMGVKFVARDPERWCVAWDFNPRMGWSIRFYRWERKGLDSIFPFPPGVQTASNIILPLRSYPVADTYVELRRGPMQEDFLRHIRSKDSLRDTHLADLAKLEAAALELLENREVYRLVTRPDRPTRVAPGDCAEPSKPAFIDRVPLTPEEKAVEAAKIKADIAVRRRLMEENYAVFYAALRRSFPLEECFDGLAKE